jgi:hypothetical protein
MQQREAIARHYAGDEAVNRVLGSAQRQWLPSGKDTRRPQDVVAVPIAGAKLTLGTLLVALREAPLVIVVLSAVFLASETWQFFARLDGWEYAKVIGGVIFLMAVILVLGLREEARHASTVPAERHTPTTDLERPLVDAGFGDPPAGLRPPWRSRASLRASHVSRLVLVCVGVGLAAAAIFALLGATAVSPQLSGSWATRAGESPNYRPHELLNISLLGKHAETVTTELLLVCGAIGAIAALAFSVELVTGERLRGELLQRRFEGYRTAFLAWARLYHGKPPPEPERE